ncbi:MAG: hypothetical protein KatS3mg034_0886 [Vicingaceae bacterium]|nr:MAG: hypothetical protein KatS3mg034_0886 [Vicingaceae bacterium]
MKVTKLFIPISISLTLLYFVISLNLFSQEKVITGGIQIKPLFPSTYLNTGPVSGISEKNIFTEIKPNPGYSFGMVIRRGLSKNFSIETGISYVRRNYRLTIKDLDSTVEMQRKYKLISYEIPIQLLVFIRLGRLVYMNVSTGLGVDFFPTDWTTYDRLHEQLILRRNWALISLNGNSGFEYRSEKNGYYYFGFSFHRPFTPIAYVNALYRGAPTRNSVFKTIFYGNYFTVDLRYFIKESKK